MGTGVGNGEAEADAARRRLPPEWSYPPGRLTSVPAPQPGVPHAAVPPPPAHPPQPPHAPNTPHPPNHPNSPRAAQPPHGQIPPRPPYEPRPAAAGAIPEGPFGPRGVRRWSAPAGAPADAAGAPGHRLPAGRRAAASALCLVLGLGLLCGAATGSWLSGGSAAEAAQGPGAQNFELARSLWHTVPVDTLFPRTLNDAVAGPGGAARSWKRIGVAPDTDCASADAFDPLLEKVLAPIGCARLLRATYTDATSSSVVTVGLLVAEGDERAMQDLSRRWIRERLGARSDLMPRPKAFPGTAAARFGDRQRASWTVGVRADAPNVVYAVSGFADGRRIEGPQPARDAVKAGATTAPAQAGLGHAAQAVADLVAKGLRTAADRLRRHPDANFSEPEQRGQR